MNLPQEIAFTPAEAGETLVVIRDRVRLKGRVGRDPAYTLAEVEVPPRGEVPLHTHPSPEILHVLEGEIEVGTAAADGRRSVTLAHPGDTVSVPGGVPHSYRNPGDRPVRMLAFFDETQEAFFRAVSLGDTPPSHPPTPEEIGLVMRRAVEHGMTILGPHGAGTAAAGA